MPAYQAKQGAADMANGKGDDMFMPEETITEERDDECSKKIHPKHAGVDSVHGSEPSDCGRRSSDR